MKSLFSTFLLFALSFALMAQSKSIFEIRYEYFNNGKKQDQNLSVFADDKTAVLDFGSKMPDVIDYQDKKCISFLRQDSLLYKRSNAFEQLVNLKEEEGMDTVLGFPCRIATGSLRSNHIRIWYADSSGVQASPSQNILLPDEKALILRVVMNGSYEIIAKSIAETKNDSLFVEAAHLMAEAEAVSSSRFARMQIENRFDRMHIFVDEVVNFTNTDSLIYPETLDSTYRYSKGTIILRKIKLPEKPQGTQVFLNLSCRSLGDAYDRTGSVFIISPETKISMIDALVDGIASVPVYTSNQDENFQGIVQNGDYQPPIELMRFFSSFGAGHFNGQSKIEGYDWPDSIIYNQEVTDLIQAKGQEVYIGVFVGNYDRKGHEVDLSLNFYPPWEKEEEKEEWLMPLFNTVNIMEMSGQNYGTLFLTDSLEVEFELPDSISGLKLIYTSTGHGGWGGGDEFNPKLNEIFIDGEKVFSFVPWRSDCGTFRMLNPSSGNFANGLSSSDLSRSNWCPGTSTPPEIIPLPALKAGKHILKIAIPMGERELQSFSAWNVSGVLMGVKL